ncbi:MAG: hypothetical protein SFX73_00745 [Kofleriaceae bacterium]|nr:hypothetical protein [Kofleriaceae bacterium]
MSRALGIAVLSERANARRGGATVGQLIWTPEMLRARLRTIRAGVESLHAQIHDHRTQLGADFLRSWLLWRQAWIAFYNEFQDTNILESAFTGVVEESEGHRIALEEWRRMLRVRGVEPIAPSAEPIERRTLEETLVGPGGSQVLEDTKGIAIAVAVVAVVGGAVFLIGRARP